MLVGDDDGLHGLDRFADLLQPFAGLARTDSGVDQDRGAVALEVVGITRAAGGERGDDHGGYGTRLRGLAVAGSRGA